MLTIYGILFPLNGLFNGIVAALILICAYYFTGAKFLLRSYWPATIVGILGALYILIIIPGDPLVRSEGAWRIAEIATMSLFYGFGFFTAPALTVWLLRNRELPPPRRRKQPKGTTHH